MEVTGQLLLRPRACCFPRVQRASRNSCRARPTGTVLLIRSDRSAEPFGGLSARTETRTAPQLNSSGRTGSGAKAMPSSCSSSIRRQSTVRIFARSCASLQLLPVVTLLLVYWHFGEHLTLRRRPRLRAIVGDPGWPNATAVCHSAGTTLSSNCSHAAGRPCARAPSRNNEMYRRDGRPSTALPVATYVTALIDRSSTSSTVSCVGR
jgi:hypothetical protein